jgi:2-iminobutanoate/2-iminopropanoate deaminase
VRYGDLLFVSGQVVADSAMGNAGSDIEAQVRNVMDSVMRILESHGLAISNIVSVTLYMRDDGLPNGSLVEIAVIAGK